MSILNITETGFNDDSIEEYEYFEYLPIVGANLNNSGGVITINIETQDIFTHPSESYLLIEGKLVKGDGTRYANAENVALTNNGLMFLFTDIRYDLSGKEIERISHPGQATTMLGLLKYSDDFSKSWGLNQLWYKDTTVAAEDGNKGWKVRHICIIDLQRLNVERQKIILERQQADTITQCLQLDELRLQLREQRLEICRNNHIHIPEYDENDVDADVTDEVIPEDSDGENDVNWRDKEPEEKTFYVSDKFSACQEEKPTIFNIPCGHVCMCKECNTKNVGGNECPICRKVIKYYYVIKQA